jgi:hypothetical protein
MDQRTVVSFLQRLSRSAAIIGVAALLALSWVTMAFAQVDGAGFDGDELGLPIVLAIAFLAYVGWVAFRRRSPKRQD